MHKSRLTAVLLLALTLSLIATSQQGSPNFRYFTYVAYAESYSQPSTASVKTTGVVTRGDNYYYVDPKTEITKTSSGFVKHAGHIYYVQQGGKLAVGKTMTIDGGKYHFGGNGAVLRGLHRWGDYYYLSNAGTGKIVTSQRFVDWRGNRFYVYSGGRLAKGTFTVGKKQYRAWSNGKIVRGVYKWGDSYSYSNPKTGEWIKKEGFVKWNGKTYYINSSGIIYANRPFVVKNLPYCSIEDGSCRRIEIIKPNNSVLSVAQKEAGIMTGRKYWRWYYGTRFIDTDRTPWCACFAAWCYNEAGQYNRISKVKRYGNLGYVPSYSKYASNYGKWVNKKYAKGGDLIVFGRGSRHIGIVERIYNGYVFTIEGNSGPTAAYGCGKPGAVTRKVYKLSDPDIKGVIRVL